MSAIDKYEKAIALDSSVLEDTLPALQYSLDKIVESHGDATAFERVISILAEAREKRPQLTSRLEENLAVAYYKWGNYFFDEKQYVTAIAKYEKAKSIVSDNSELQQKIIGANN